MGPQSGSSAPLSSSRRCFIIYYYFFYFFFILCAGFFFNSMRNEGISFIVAAYTEKTRYSISFQIEWDMIVVLVFLSILNQMEFHLVQNRKENCHHDHIPVNVKGVGNIVFSVWQLIAVFI